MYTADSSVYMKAHKHLILDQSKIDRARRHLGVETDTQAIDRALDLLLEDAAIAKVVESIGGVGGIEDPYGARARVRKARR